MVCPLWCCRGHNRHSQNNQQDKPGRLLASRLLHKLNDHAGNTVAVITWDGAEEGSGDDAADWVGRGTTPPIEHMIEDARESVTVVKNPVPEQPIPEEVQFDTSPAAVAKRILLMFGDRVLLSSNGQVYTDDAGTGTVAGDSDAVP